MPARTSATVPIHPPKVELFDVDAGTNTDPKGFVRAVEEYRVEPFGLFLARPVVAHPRIRAFQSWLLPSLGLRVTDWCFHPGHERDQDFYVDVVRVDVDGPVWRTEDHYLDLVVRTGREVELVDLDELLAAVHGGLLDPPVAEQALRITFRLADGLAHNGYDLAGWLAEQGAPLTWNEWTPAPPQDQDGASDDRNRRRAP